MAGYNKVHDRVAKTCRPCRPVGANFFWLVLIFGQYKPKICHLAYWATITANCTNSNQCVSSIALVLVTH